MSSPETVDSPVRSHLSLADAVSVIIGIVIGAGIYETAPFILACVATPGDAMLVWALGGVLSVIGALSYAELATTYPKLGGDYYFLRRAFGPGAGFLFSWSQLTIIMSGSIGLMAFVFADYAVRLFGGDATAAPLYAAAAIVVFSVANVVGLQSGRRAQNLLTGLKALGLTAIVVAGFWGPRASTETLTVAADPASGAGFGLALILVLYTYGGWNDAAFIVAEMKNKRRNIPRALLLGTAGVAVIYLLVNAAYLHALGFEGARRSTAIAADVLHNAFGGGGGQAMAVLVMISALGALNGLILTGARISAAAGADFAVLAPLAPWHARRGTPVRAIVAQMVVTLALVLLVGHDVGRRVLNSMLGAAGVAPLAWDGHGGFDTLLKCTAPVFWVFFLLTGLSLFVLRVKDRGLERPFSVPLFPILPAIFCLTCAWMLYSAVTYAGVLAWIGFAPPAIGVIVFLLAQRRRGADATSASTERR